MEFSIQKGELLRELQTVTGVVEKRATLPILANLLIEARTEGLQVGASDLEVTIRGTANATVAKPGGVTLPASKLVEIARSLPDAEVKFKLLEHDQVAISCERTKYKIAGQARQDFPQFPDVDVEKTVQLPGAPLRSMIERVAFAITTEDPRYSMHGALLLLSKTAVTLVATDGFRLAYVSKKAAIAKQDAEERVIVPRKALTELAKMLSELAEGESIRFGRSGNQIFFVVARHILTSTVPETVFPRYEEVMPKGCDTEIVVPTADLADAVRRVSLVASERLGKTIRFHFSHGEMELSSQTELGEAQEALPIAYQGEEKVVGFSARYLQEFLAVVASPSVRIELDPRRGGDEDEQRKRRSGDKQAQFRPEPSGDIDYRYIVMPRDL